MKHVRNGVEIHETNARNCVRVPGRLKARGSLASHYTVLLT